MVNHIFIWATVVFLLGYLINIFYITVLYHRGLTHSAVELSPFARWWVVKTGIWMTGIDPKAWACMHRMHHQFSDTEKDPHSPWTFGILGVAFEQLKSYEKILVGLIKNKATYIEVVRDLDFPVSYLNRKKIWWIPYFVHLLIAVVFYILTSSWMIGVAYWLGIMSHPVQGWLVNSLAHRFGYRNHATSDESRNNTLVAWLVAGEGYQNNHHARPSSPKFSERRFEFDGGYILCKLAVMVGFLKIREGS